MKRLLTIAGSDCSGGAGIQADLKTFAALHCHGMSVLTALTAQNTLGVQAIEPVASSFVKRQLEAILQDSLPDAIKIGMVYSKEVVEILLQLLPLHIPLVVDPVMFAKRGEMLLQKETLESLWELLKRATVVTPNKEEALILGYKERPRDLLQKGLKAVLIKGEGTDWLGIGEQEYLFKGKKIGTRNLHGSGCTLSSAIAVFLAQGETLFTAVKKAKQYHRKALLDAKELYFGQGIGPLCHFKKEKTWKFM